MRTINNHRSNATLCRHPAAPDVPSPAHVPALIFVKARSFVRGWPLAGMMALVWALAFVVVLAGCGPAADKQTKAIRTTAAYIAEQVPDPAADSSDAGWAVIAFSSLEEAGALSRKETARIVPEDYAETYYESARRAVKDKKFSEKSDGQPGGSFTPTDCARVTMALAASGKNPLSIEGQDITKPLDRYKTVRAQGLNAEIFALIAAGVSGKRLKNSDRYVKDILAARQPDGGIAPGAAFTSAGDSSGSAAVREKSDIDISAMALQALSLQTENRDVKKAADRVVRYLSGRQQSDGSCGNAESTAQVIIALTMYGRDPDKDKSFRKNGHTLSDGLMAYREKTGFSHTKGGEVDLMASGQALLALEAMKLYSSGRQIYGTGKNSG